MIAIRGKSLSAARLDHDWTVEPGLFLKTKVRVIPVRAVLIHLEVILVGFTGRNAIETQARHAIHVGGNDHAVPVD